MNNNKYKSNLEFVVDKPIILMDYLISNVKDKSRNNIKSLLKRGNVLVNNKKVTQFDYQLKIGQKVTVVLAQIVDKEKSKVIDIIYEDDDLIVINKDAGLLSISTSNDKLNTAYKMVLDYVKRKNPKFKVFVVHRLDRDTSGVMVFAKKENIKNMLQNNWNELVLTRGYIGVVGGVVKKDSGTIRSWLNETKTMVVYSGNKSSGGKEAITRYKKIKNNKLYSLLEIEIDTGRKNQIRVHMKDIGHSIIGDKKYGSIVDPIKRLGLHANILEFKHPVTNKVMRFEADVPKSFISIVK